MHISDRRASFEASFLACREGEEVNLTLCMPNCVKGRKRVHAKFKWCFWERETYIIYTSKVEKMVGWRSLMSKVGITTFVKV